MSESMEDILAAFRSLEKPSDAIVIIGDRDAIRVLSAWTRVDNLWTAPGGPVPAVRHGRMGQAWRWVCAGWTVDVDEVARLAGVPRSIAHAKLEVLRGNRLIFPDGSMSKGAELALAAYTGKVLGPKVLGLKQKDDGAPSRRDVKEPKKDDNTN
jgi:hypothetical protein